MMHESAEAADDRQWYQRYPARIYRVRKPFPSEVPTDYVDATSLVIVGLIADGCRQKIMVNIEPGMSWHNSDTFGASAWRACLSKTHRDDLRKLTHLALQSGRTKGRRYAWLP